MCFYESLISHLMFSKNTVLQKFGQNGYKRYKIPVMLLDIYKQLRILVSTRVAYFFAEKWYWSCLFLPHFCQKSQDLLLTSQKRQKLGTLFFFYKHNVYKHTEAQTPQKSKHTLSIPPASRCWYKIQKSIIWYFQL